MVDPRRCIWNLVLFWHFTEAFCADVGVRKSELCVRVERKQMINASAVPFLWLFVQTCVWYFADASSIVDACQRRAAIIHVGLPLSLARDSIAPWLANTIHDLTDPCGIASEIAWPHFVAIPLAPVHQGAV